MSPQSPMKVTISEEEKVRRAKILEIQRDKTLTEAEKNHRIQQLHGGGKWLVRKEVEKDPLDGLTQEEKDSVTCGICLSMVSRPISLPCQHNMCLDCLKGIRKMDTAMRKCPYCRKEIHASFIDNARINMTIVSHVRMLKAKSAGLTAVVTARVHRLTREDEEERPEEAFITERAVRKGMANAASGSLKMTCAADHFGPIGPEYDPRRNRGLVVGDMFPNRMSCRMWNAHLPHVAGIAGQGNRGAQSVVLSGGYIDDVDEGEHFLYTGSGGKDLSGNKRNGAHDKDQEFSRYNLALKKSCEEGLPVRVIRSHKEKRSAYAPKPESIKELQELAAEKEKKGKREGGEKEDDEAESDSDDDDAAASGDGDEDADEEEDEEGEGGGKGRPRKAAGSSGGGGAQHQLAKAQAFNPVRYDGIYRVLACWRTRGAASYLVCRYLFVRCDNTPAPWSSDDSGDKLRMEIPPNAAKEIAEAKKLKEEITYMTKTPYWDYDPVMEEWAWARPPPLARTAGAPRGVKQDKPLEKQLEAAERELKRMTKQLMDAYSCSLCHQLVAKPVYTPCAHSFCMDCLKGKLDGSDNQARHNSRPSRTSSQRKPCPARGCGKDLTSFVRDMQINTTMAGQTASAGEGVRLKEQEIAALRKKVEAAGDEGDEAAEKEPQQVEEEDQQQEGAEEKPRGTAAAACVVPSTSEASSVGEEVETEEDTVRSSDGGAPASRLVDEPMVDADEGAGRGPTNEAAAEPADEGGEGAGRWLAEASSLALRYPDFDAALISGMLEDQGGDVEEVDAYLKRIKRGQQRATQSPQRNAAGKRGGAKEGRGRSKRQVKAGSDKDGGGKEEAEEEAAEEEEAEVVIKAAKPAKGKAAASKRRKVAS